MSRIKKGSNLGSGISILQAATALGQFQRLASLVDPANGNDRWAALQDWLNTNPKYRAIFEEHLEMVPSEVVEKIVDYLCQEYQIPKAGLDVFDRSGEVRQKAILAISRIQELYKERQNAE